jgi:hypothetical protein
LYVFVKNDGVNNWDYLGYYSLSSVIRMIPLVESAGLDFAENIIKWPLYPGVTLNVDLFLTVNVKKCGCKGDGLMFSGSGGFEVYAKGGVSYQKNNKGRGKIGGKRGVKDPNYNMFGKKRITRRRDLNGRKDPKGFRNRDFHLDVDKGKFPECPKKFSVSGTLSVFVRGSAGAYFGAQFNAQYSWPITSPSFDGIQPGHNSLIGTAARGIYGVSIEVGGGGSSNLEKTLKKSGS